MTRPGKLPYIRIPPFPGHRGSAIARRGPSVIDVERAAEAARLCRVGGNFWGPQPELTAAEACLYAPRSAAQLKAMLAQSGGAPGFVVGPASWDASFGIPVVDVGSDPWWLVDHAIEVWADRESEIALTAAIAGRPLILFAPGADRGSPDKGHDLIRAAFDGWQYNSPFDGNEISAVAAIEILGGWRQLIDSNRPYEAIYGITRWKRVTVDPLLWDGSGPVRHRRSLPRDLGPGTLVACWKSRTSRSLLGELEQTGAAIAEIEDGFLRSAGLGANCVPPLSIIVDRSGIYFDPAAPSDLETLLEQSEFPHDLLKRAEALRLKLAASSISKYGADHADIPRTGSGSRRVLVTGQVEDDRSIISGGGNCSNLQLLERARDQDKDAWLIYKPHPDVEAGHRKGYVGRSQLSKLADEVQVSAPIAPLIDSVDELQVITSLAGFEGLLRGKQVTTHGMPFYAGWGLTRDLSTKPNRRSRSRSIDELVAATLLIYPRYCDPVTRLPCSAELLVERMETGRATIRTPLVTLREWQGRIGLAWRRLIGKHR